MSSSPSIIIENGINLKECMTEGSLIQINHFDENDDYEPTENVNKNIESLGPPVTSFDAFEQNLENVDTSGYVKKKVLEEGGGAALDETYTISIAYSGYFENEQTPFESVSTAKALEVDLNDNGLLPGLQIAVKSMLVGELSVFILSYQLMYGIMGNPDRIKPKAKCLYYIKLVKSIITPKDGKINLSQANMFERVHKEVRHMYLSGVQLHNTKNFPAAIQLFKRAVNMLHKCRLADEKEEMVQQKLLLKLYMNLAVCYNKTKQPLRTCISCNEINYLTNIWNHGRALYQNAKALRMIGDFKRAEKKLRRAMHLIPNNEDMEAELTLLLKTKNTFNQPKLKFETENKENSADITDEYKSVIDNLIKTFKEDDEMCQFTLPPGLTKAEVEYVTKVCKSYGVYCNKMQNNFALDKANDEFISSNMNELLDALKL